MTSADLTATDFQRQFGAETLPPACLALIDALDFRHEVLTNRAREDVLLRAVKALFQNLAVSGAHRHGRWEDGWRENLEEFVASGYDINTLVPKFVRRGEVVRLEGNYIASVSDTFETNYVKVLREYLFRTFFADTDAVFEFGCGTGHNLVQLAGMYPHLALTGLDWAQSSVDILTLLHREKGLNITGRRFDLFSPDETVTLPDRTGVLTIGTLEQLGTDNEPFIRYLLDRRPQIVVHVETLYELYDQDDLFDYVAAQYLIRRNYLRGLIPLLQRLAEDGLIEILALRRGFGSLHHDGYSFVVWRPTGPDASV